MSISPETSCALEHLSHLHPLVLMNDDVIARGALCCVCDRTIIGSATYICTSRDIDEDCENYYLHKSCAELPTSIVHHKHKDHNLLQKLRPYSSCDVCDRGVKLLAYACEDCDFDVCVICSFEKRVLDHAGHEEHSLTLMPRNAVFECDACGDEGKDSSYVCTDCDFWIHRACAMAPLVIETNYHRHPLRLIYSIPEIHRYFSRSCATCRHLVRIWNWMYYCDKCTYFVHMGCALDKCTYFVHMGCALENTGSRVSDTDDELDLVQFPLPSEESLLELFSGNLFQVDFQSNDPDILKEHWSHNHPLEKFQFISSSESDNEDNSDDRRVMICDGCIQPISEFHLSYYACVQCAFFLHLLCATKLPKELPKGASTFHPEHPVSLRKTDRFYKFVICGVCSFPTNGFYYHCESCDIKVDIRCAFLPKRIKHKSHKQHSLTMYRSDKSKCSASQLLIREGTQYACMTCTDFQIHILCAFYPLTIKHKYDLHLITLRQPPFFHEGKFYCYICEEQVNNQLWLYYCDKCDRGYHCDCVRQYENVKLGGTIKLRLHDENHTFALVLKRPEGKKSSVHICFYCKHEFKHEFLFECDGCGFLACCKCVNEILGE